MNIPVTLTNILQSIKYQIPKYTWCYKLPDIHHTMGCKMHLDVGPQQRAGLMAFLLDDEEANVGKKINIF